MCWPGARLETLCSWKEREQKPAKEGGKGAEGEERTRKAGRREGEKRWGSEEVEGLAWRCLGCRVCMVGRERMERREER